MHAEESEIGPSRHPFIFYAGLIFVCAAMLASGAFMYRIPAKQAESGTWVSHTHEVMERLNALEPQRG